MISTPNPFSCFIIGEGSLPIQCAEILLRRGHEICGIISPDASVNRWAEGKHISYANPKDDLTAFIRQHPFDYLLSIANVANCRTLLKEILELPHKCAINYHDALLPRYAGFHTTSWALMHREATHGVSWHVMTNRMDAGEILRQCPVDIADDDTAFTLNAKCYDAAIRSFTELVEDLLCDRALGKKQNLDQRTYFPLYRRPPAGCVVRWNRCAQDIDAFVRALDFGPYPNPLGLPKLAIGADFFIIPEIDVLDSMSETTSGTITAIEHGFLKISTADREIALCKVLTIDGQPLPISDLVARLELREGDRFSDLAPDIARRITALDAAARRHEEFWVNRLATLQPITLADAARKASHVKPAQYETVPVHIPEEVIPFLASRRADWSMGDFLLTAFAAYLSRIGGVCRFDIGFTDFKLQRNMAGLEKFFASHVPLLVNLDYTQDFEDVFRGVREQLDLVRCHKTYARDVVARYPQLRSAPELQRCHALPVIVDLTEKSSDYKAVPGSELTLVISGAGADCRWVYDAGVLNEDSVVRMVGQFATFLQGIAVEPDRLIADLPLLTPKERQHVLVQFNNTQTDYPHDGLHQLFEAQVKRTPDAVAVTFEDEQLTYGKLNRRANQLAHYLRKLGVGPEVLVGICMERSVEMVVGVLGILKAGGAYVPLDLTYPNERLAFMLREADASVLLSQQHLIESLPKYACHRVCLDRDWRIIEQENEDDPVSTTVADNSAYVIYTSGSTGLPKGVQISHRAIGNHMAWMQRQFPLTEEDSVVQKTAFSFDASVWEFFAPLLAGAHLIMARPGGHQDCSYLVKLIAEKKITVLQLVPSVLRLVLAEKEIESLRCLKRVFCGGEALSPELAEQFFSRLNVDLHNLYGPAEASIDATFWTCREEKNLRSVPIGRPIANTQTYLLDSNLQPVPIGVAGQLHIAGDGLARGYLNRPELTAEKFIPNPFTDRPGARLYKTGDLACYLPDGNIEFLGRLDHQVKVRGFRIELAEVEATLKMHPAVQAAIVVAREDNPGDQRLVAYIVPRQGQEITVNGLRGFLTQKLPDYMVPLAFITLETLPLTPNGKVDRRALPAPAISTSGPDRVYVPPQNELEKSIIEIWQQVFGVEKVGTQDNFFDLGGHSLLMMQVLQKLRNVIGRDIPFVRMFQYPTIRTLARSLSQDSDTQPSLQQSADRGQARRELMRRRQPRQGTRPPRSLGEQHGYGHA